MAQFDDINLLRIQRGTKKRCKCRSIQVSYTVDPDTRTVYCNGCGAEVEAFDAIYNVSRNGRNYLERYNAIQNDIVEAERRRTTMRVFKSLERWYKGPNKMYPRCPVCLAPFAFEEISSHVSPSSAIAERPEIAVWDKPSKEET